MNKHRLQSIIEQIAIASNMTPEDVRNEMLLAMEAGQSSHDPIIQARWSAIPRKGDKLTLEEFIDYVAHEAALPMS